jgi:hypothetical protein
MRPLTCKPGPPPRHSAPAAQIIGVPLTLGQGELVQFAADHGRGAVVPKDRLMAGDGAPLADALRRVVVDSRDEFRRQVRGPGPPAC